MLDGSISAIPDKCMRSVSRVQGSEAHLNALHWEASFMNSLAKTFKVVC